MGIVEDVGDVGDPSGVSYIAGTLEWGASGEPLPLKMPAITDHLLRLPVRFAMLGWASEERPSCNEVGGASSSVPDGVAPIIIGACGLVVPAGGRSGTLLSKRA